MIKSLSSRAADVLTHCMLVLFVALPVALGGCGEPGSAGAQARTEAETPSSAVEAAPQSVASVGVEATDSATEAANKLRDSTWPGTIRVGLVPTEGGADTQARFQPLKEHLEATLGLDVELVSASAYQGVITAMANNQVDFAWFGPKSYVEAAKRADAEALVMELNPDGEPGYRSVFIVPADSKVQTLQDAKDKRFAFTDPNSTSGSLIPQLMLRDVLDTTAGEFFGEVRHSGSHSTSVMLVAKGEVDIAAVGDVDMRRLMQLGTVREDAVRIVHSSDLIPGAPFAARRVMPETLKEAFSLSLLELANNEAAMENFQIGGYQRASDSEYDLIRAVQKFLEEQKNAG